MEGISTRCMVVLAPADILSQGTGRDGRDSQLAWEINRAHHDGAVLADSPGTCCPPHLRSNAKCKSTEKGKYQIYLFTFPDSCSQLVSLPGLRAAHVFVQNFAPWHQSAGGEE